MKSKTGFQNARTDTIVSIIVVTHNDEGLISGSLEEIAEALRRLNVNYEILIVDNASTDQTISRIREPNKASSYTRTLVLSREYDTEVALTAGLDNCVGDFAILFNIHSDPVEVIGEIVSRLDTGVDVVMGKFKKGSVRINSFGGYLITLMEKFSKHGFSYRPDYLTGFNRKAINSITRTRRKSRNFSYINYLIGFKKEYLEYTPLPSYLETHIDQGFVKLFLGIIDTLISNSFKPIRFLSFLGVFGSILFLAYVFVVVVLMFVFNMKWLAPQGWISVATVLGAMFFMLFSLLTIMSEYIIRILNEVRDEPLYFISEELDKSVILPKSDVLNID